MLKFVSNIEIFVKFWIYVFFHFEAPSKLLRCLNSKEIQLHSSLRVICISFRSDFFQLNIKKKTKIWNSTTTISICDANFNTVINKMIRTLLMFEKIVSWNCNKLQKNMSPWNNCKILFRLTIKNHFNVKLLNCNYSSLYNYTTFQIPGNSSSFHRTIPKYEVKISMKLYFKLYT